ncbi:MAG: hypothetical protein LUC93_04680 [Planctomycetaceae bacterium]|nr:hypothetical protein [Planctomycetaceae bacterium]
MSPSLFARAAFAVVFLAAYIGVAVLNTYYNGAPVWDTVMSIFDSTTTSEVREKSRAVLQLANNEYIGKYDNAEIRAQVTVALGKREMNNFGVIRGDSGRLYSGGLAPLDMNNAARLAKTLERLTQIAAETGTRVLYLSPPAGAIPKQHDVPKGVPVRDLNVIIDRFLYAMREREAPFLDARFFFADRHFPVDELSIRSGYLFTGDAVLTLHASLVEGLEKRFGLDLDPDGFFRDPSHYTLTTYPEFFIGTLGKATGPSFGGVDDFTTIVPAFETEYNFQGLDIFGASLESQGTAENTVLNPAALQVEENLYNFYPDAFYRHAILTWSKVVNIHGTGKPKVLFVHDFFTASLASLLAPQCSELHTLSSQTNQSVSVENYIREKDFDCIIVSFFPGGILQPENQRLLLSSELVDDIDEYVDNAVESVDF